jgi:hypothetical protein
MATLCCTVARDNATLKGSRTCQPLPASKGRGLLNYDFLHLHCFAVQKNATRRRQINVDFTSVYVTCIHSLNNEVFQ